ncbi:MAG: 16S rRNA (cytidine(1402)-2'-O)-methyltransferase [Ignavibacteriae bacterium]|nr:16S rRNA (cytidine(1402)-2'-O)-methyltransferase [Ignavibacteriota bacterium]
MVSTPIGNLEDISFHALYILKNVDMIATEDTRVAQILLNHYGIRQKLVSYYSQVENSKLDYITGFINEGNSVALISDAGTPCISDPGSILVNRCIEEGINVVAIPGASSLIHALVLSGFKNDKFYFHGFLPQKKGREKTFNELKDIKENIILFESKFRIKKTISELAKNLGNKEVVIGREMTKKFEEIYRGRLRDIDANIIKEKGEFVIIIMNYEF